MRSHVEVIEAFGGTKPLAEAIGVDPKRAIHWGRRGIPAKYWHRIEQIAHKHRLVITAVDLGRMSEVLATSEAA